MLTNKLKSGNIKEKRRSKEVCMEIETCRSCEVKCRGTIDMCLKEDNGSDRKSNS